MDVKLPNGTVINGVPDGTTKLQLAQKLKANGMDVPKDWLNTPAPKPTVAPPSHGMEYYGARALSDLVHAGFNPLNVIPTGIAETGIHMGSGMAGKVLGDVAGLSTIAKDYLTGTQTDPGKVQQAVQGALTYQPKTLTGQLITKYNPANLVGMPVNYVAGKVEKAIAGPPGVNAATWRGALARGTGETLRQAPAVIGGKVGEVSAGRLAKMQKVLDVAKARNARIDTMAEQANKLNLPIPTKRTGWRAKIFGETNVNAPNLIKVKEATDEAIRQDFNLPKETPIDVQTMEKVREKNAKPYRALNNFLKTVKTKVEVPTGESNPITGEPVLKTQQTNGIASDTRFKNTLKALYEPMNSLYESNTETFKSFASPLKMLKQDMEASHFDGKNMVHRIKTMRQEASKDFRSGDTNKEAEAFVKIKVANALEDLVDRTLKQHGQENLLANLKKARVQYAKSYEYENAMRPDGSLDLRKFSKLANEKKLTGNAKVLAQYGAKFPQMAKAISPTKGAVGPFDYLLYAMHRPKLAVAHIASHLAPDVVSKENYLPPNYTAPTPIGKYIAPPLILSAMTEKKRKPPQ